jgi:hypothetical protein
VYAGADGMLLHINGKFTIGRLHTGASQEKQKEAGLIL